MTKNPLINALAAAAYIAFVGFVMMYGSQWVDGAWVASLPQIVFPIGMLSALVFSVAMMAFIFFSQPVLLFLDGQKQEGTKLFLSTLGLFALTTLIVLGGIFISAA